MNSSLIVLKLWNYCNLLPACRAVLDIGRCDDLSACGAQPGGVGREDYVEPLRVFVDGYSR